MYLWFFSSSQYLTKAALIKTFKRSFYNNKDQHHIMFVQ